MERKELEQEETKRRDRKGDGIGKAKLRSEKERKKREMKSGAFVERKLRLSREGVGEWKRG